MCCKESSDTTRFPNVVFEYIDGGDILDFILVHDGLSEPGETYHMPDVLSSFSTPQDVWDLASTRDTPASMSTRRASPTAISSPRYAVSAEFARQLHYLTLVPFRRTWR